MPRQKNTKLSLKKSTSSDNKSKDVKPVLPAGGCFDLNETCNFQQPAVFRGGHGDGNIKSESEDVDSVESANSTGEDVLCQVCSKNLAHMNVQRRQQHVNRCIDKVEVSERLKNEEQKMLESAKTAVLDCPMCGKHFKTENSRLSHLKKCSQDLGVSTEKMLQLVKEQEEERNVHIAAGIIPQQLKAQVSKGKVAKKRKLKEPKNSNIISQYEEDVQVAMAMSSSLAMESDHAGGQSDRERGKKQKKNKNLLEDVCLLTTLTDADRQRRIQEKVSNILHTVNGSYKMYTVGSLCESSIKLENQQSGASLWEKCSKDPNLCHIDMFYVGALVPPISVSTVKPGANLRRMSSIPGRESSFISEKQNYTEKVSSGISSLGNISQDEVITASTQMVAVLAELAVDDTDLSQTRAGSRIIPTQRSNHNTSLVDLQASGFCVQTLVLQSKDQALIHAETLSDYKKLINNREYSDVSIESLNGDKFCAHKLILAARCPKLLQMMKDSVIRLDVPSDIVLSLLEFVYCGNVTVTLSVQSELEKLAKQLEFTTLIEACKKLELPEDTGDQLQTDNIDNEDEFVESQIDLKEIWGESDSDSDEQDNGKLRDSKSTDENTDKISEDSEASSEDELEIFKADNDGSRQCDVLVKNIDENDEETSDSDEMLKSEITKADSDGSKHCDVQVKNNDDSNDVSTGDGDEMLKNRNNSADEDSEHEIKNRNSSADRNIEPAKEGRSKSQNFREAGNIDNSRFAYWEVSLSSNVEADIKNTGNNCDKINGEKRSKDEERRSTVVRKVSAFQLGSSQSDVSRNSYSESSDLSDDNVIISDGGVLSDGDAIPDDNDNGNTGSTDTEVLSYNVNSKRRSFKRGLDESNCNGNATFKRLTENNLSLPDAKRLRYSAEMKETVDSFVDSNDSCHDGAPDERRKSDGDKNKTFEIADEGFENSSQEMDTSAVDLFGTPSPRKSSVTVLEGVSFLKERLKVVSKFSTPLESRPGTNHSLISGNSPISPLIQSKHAGSKKILGEDIKIIKDNDQDLLHKEAETFVVGVETETSSVESDRLNSTAVSGDDMVSSDDDIEITGDNFHEISQQSPTFSHSRSQSRSSNCSTNFVLSSTKINKTMFLGIQSTAGDLCSNKTVNIDGEKSSSEKEEFVRSQTFSDSGSESEEIVTIETKGSEGCENRPSENDESEDIVTIESEGSDAGDKCQSENSDYDQDNDGNDGSHAKKRSNSYKTSVNSTLGCSEKDTSGADVGAIDVDDEGETDDGNDTVVDDAGCTDNSVLQNQSFGYDADGVWEDFEDCGVEFEPAVTSPVEITAAKCETDSKARSGNFDQHTELGDGETEDNLLEDGDDSFVFKVDDDIDISVDPKQTVPQKSKFKTPTSTISREQRRRPWVPPSPFTPMPTYSGMPTPVLKKEIQKYGVKPVGKKRMVKMLEDIYHQTHQYETDSECEEEPRDPATSSGTGAACVVDEGTTEPDEDCASNQDDLCSSQGDFSSQDSDMSDVLEESCLHMASSDSDTTSSPQKNIDVTKKMLDYMKSNAEIHFKVLTYEPLELDVLKKDMKEAGIKCSMDKLMDFLDERCIAFTTKNSRKRPTGRRGRQKKTKAKGSDNKTSDISNSANG